MVFFKGYLFSQLMMLLYKELVQNLKIIADLKATTRQRIVKIYNAFIDKTLLFQ